jgi:hypothetical protein
VAETGAQQPAVPRDKRAQEWTQGCDRRRSSGNLPDKSSTSGSAGQARAGVDPRLRQAQIQWKPAGRVINQRFRGINARRSGPKAATGADPVETCRTSHQPAVPRDKRAQERTGDCDRRRFSGNLPAERD